MGRIAAAVCAGTLARTRARGSQSTFSLLFGMQMTVVQGRARIHGRGLPDRLRARGVTNVLVISQVDESDLSDDEAETLLTPHPRYGPRADVVRVTQATASRSARDARFDGAPGPR